MMRAIFKSLLVAAILVLAPISALAQGSPVNLWCWNSAATIGADQYKPCNSSTPLQIAGTITATVSGGTVTGTGTAGTAATGVLTVQGIASMTPLLATVSGGGTAGSAASGVVTVQGIASMTPVQVSQATATNLNAVVTGSGTAGSAAAGVVSVQGVASMTPVVVALASGGYPSGATAITGNATGTTGAVVGSLANASAKTTYICGFSVSAIGGTAAVGPITIANTITASLVYYLASTATGVNLTQTFNPCIPASATNTAITTTTTADGSASNVAVNSWGFQQ